MRPTKSVSRRSAIRLIGVGVTAAATCGCIGNAQALDRLSQAAAGYQNTPKGPQICGGCPYFQAPNRCQVVAGDISVSGWCRLFTAFPLTDLVTN